jgi:transcription initiation factor TFIIB
MKQQTVHAQCPECGSPDIVKDKDMGELICTSCGLVTSGYMLNRAPEWRAYTLEEYKKRRRVGPPIDYTHYDKGLNTFIDNVNRDAKGQTLPSKTRKRIWRLRKWDNRTKIHTSRNRNLAQAMTELKRLSEKLKFSPSVQKTAALLYRRALKKDLVQGRAIASIIGAALYAACRFTETPRSLREVAKASLKSRKEIARSYRLLIRHLGIKMPTHDPVNYLNKIAEKARIPSDVQTLAFKILTDAKRQKITMGKHPRGITAAALYIACKQMNKDITQKTIAKAANISEVTLRNRKKDLSNKLHEMQLTHYPAFLMREVSVLS